MAEFKKNNSSLGLEEIHLQRLGVKCTAEINEWCIKAKEYEYSIPNLEKAAEIIINHANNGGDFVVCGDYDVDGVTATSIVLLGLKELGIDAEFTIPDRFDGYGLSKKQIDNLLPICEPSNTLLITVDNGVMAHEAIGYAYEKGFKVVITDHHPLAGIDTPPTCEVVVDPNVIKGEFNDYCGAGIAYRLVLQMLKEVKPEVADAMRPVLMSLAALGTVADVMSLREENWVIVKYGLKYLINPRSTTLGTYGLVSALSLTANVSAKNVGFKIGPCINALSRMKGKADMAVRLLTSTSETTSWPQVVKMAETLIEINEKRKSARKAAIEAAEQYIMDNCLYGEFPMMLKLDIPEGLCGIIAGVYAEKFKTPCICVTNTPEGLKGSGRSFGNFKLNQLLKIIEQEDDKIFVRWGGHEAAVGVTVSPSKYDELSNLCKQNAIVGIEEKEEYEDGDYIVKGEEMLQFNGVEFTQVGSESAYSWYDQECMIKEISSIIEVEEKFEPTGNGNEPIRFRIQNFLCQPLGGKFASYLGDGSYCKVICDGVEAMGNVNDIPALRNITGPVKLDIIGTLSNNYFNGKITPFIDIMDAHVVVEKKTTELADLLGSL